MISFRDYVAQHYKELSEASKGDKDSITELVQSATGPYHRLTPKTPFTTHAQKLVAMKRVGYPYLVENGGKTYIGTAAGELYPIPPNKLDWIIEDLALRQVEATRVKSANGKQTFIRIVGNKAK